MKSKGWVLLLLIALMGWTLTACKARSRSITLQADTTSHATSLPEKQLPPDTLQVDGMVYRKSGKTIADFIPNAGAYTVQYEATGDLNMDGLADQVAVLRNKDTQQHVRPVLVLLANRDKTYHLDKVSHTAFPAEYNEVGANNYDTEDVSIVDSALHFDLYSPGPSGNLSCVYRYTGKNLLLTLLDTYHMGAGSHSEMVYYPLEGIVTLEVINTSEEEMPSETTSHPVNKNTHPFESTVPETLVPYLYQLTQE